MPSSPSRSTSPARRHRPSPSSSSSSSPPGSSDSSDPASGRRDSSARLTNGLGDERWSPAKNGGDGKPSAQDVVMGLAAKKSQQDYQRLLDMQRGGVYIPPHRMKALQEQLQREAGDSVADERIQRLRWDALRKSINGLVNKVNTANIVPVVQELFQENLVRGRGLLCRSIMKAQMASPTFTPVYAALVAVINTKMPEIGELLLHRLVLQWRQSFRRNDKLTCLAVINFLGHLVNQKVAHELVALQLLALLLEKPTNDSVEISVEFVKQIGATLMEISPTGMHGILERLRSILHEAEIDVRTQYQIEEIFRIRKSEFRDFPAIPAELDLVEADDQITHEVSLTGDYNARKAELDIFHYDPEYQHGERLYEEIKAEILGAPASSSESGSDSNEDASSSDSDDDAGSSPGDEQEEGEADGVRAAGLGQSGEPVQDRTHQHLINLRRTIYLTIMSSLDVEDCTHKLLRLDILKDEEAELCNMIIECCSKERSYNSFYALIGERLCKLNQRKFADQFDECFAIQYATIHRYEENCLRNIAKFFAHLLYTDALEWSCLSYIHLNEQETTSSSRIFIKILFRYLSELMGLQQLKARLESPAHAEDVAGLFPRDTPKNVRYSINFFTSIGLGGLTEGQRSYLKNVPKLIMAQRQAELLQQQQLQRDSSSDSDSDSSSSSSSSTSSSSSDSDSSSSSSDSSSSDSESGDRRRRRSSSRKSEDRKRSERSRRQSSRRSRSASSSSDSELERRSRRRRASRSRSPRSSRRRSDSGERR